MYLAYNIAVYKLPSEEVTTTVRSIMRGWDFDLASDEVAAQALKTPAVDVLPEFDETLVFRKFLISPYSNQWCMVYPSTGWFSEVQDLSVTLSKRLSCAAMLLLADDSAGWGYELSHKGQIVDRFHTRPADSETLREKREFTFQREVPAMESSKVGTEGLTVDITTLARLVLPTSDQMAEMKRELPEDYAEDQLTPEKKVDLEERLESTLAELGLPTSKEKAKLAEEFLRDPSIIDRLSTLSRAELAEAEKYRGNPSIVANTFDVAMEEVAELLSKSRNIGFGSHNEMRRLAELLGIKDFDVVYQELVQEGLTDARWHHLIFARRMSAAQAEWYEKGKVDFPYISPPLWLDESDTDQIAKIG